MSLSKLLPHSHLILYLIGISLLIIPNFFPHLSQIQARNMKDFIKAAEDDQPLNMAKFSKEGWGADTTNVGQSFYSIEATENTDGTFNYHYGGAVAVLAQGISYIAVVPPATTGEYLADVLKNTHLVPQAYAQGLGFSSLSPILQVWKAFRNVSYFLFIIVFIVVGFM